MDICASGMQVSFVMTKRFPTWLLPVRGSGARSSGVLGPDGCASGHHLHPPDLVIIAQWLMSLSAMAAPECGALMKPLNASRFSYRSVSSRRHRCTGCVQHAPRARPSAPAAMAWHLQYNEMRMPQDLPPPEPPCLHTRGSPKVFQARAAPATGATLEVGTSAVPSPIPDLPGRCPPRSGKQTGAEGVPESKCREATTIARMRKAQAPQMAS